MQTVAQGLKSVREDLFCRLSEILKRLFEDKNSKLASLCDVASQQVGAEIKFSRRH
jgi:hypothetical protein